MTQALVTQAPTGASEEARTDTCRLRLFVARGEPNSTVAQANFLAFCEENLPPGSQVEVLDVSNSFQEALRQRIIVTPTLIVETGTSVVRILGNLADKSVVVSALGLGR